MSIQYELLRARARRPDDYPPAQHLEVSRLSTYLPSFSSIKDAEATFRRGQYRSFSDAALLTSLGHYGDGDPYNRLEERRLAQRQALNAYLDQQGVTSHTTAFVADIGWRGSIQDNLARLRPDTVWHGFYFHLQPFRIDQAVNTKKEEFLLPTARRNTSLLRRLRFAAPLEFLLADRSGVVLGYDLRDGLASPQIEKDNDLFDAATWARLLLLRAEMEQGAVDLSLDSTSAAERVLDETLMLLEKPSRNLYELYFAARRDERFGTGVMIDIKPLAMIDLILALVSARSRRSVGETLAASGWPWAMLQRDAPMIAPLIRRALLALDPSLDGGKP